MARRKRRLRRKRRYKRKRNRRNIRSVIVRGPSAFPDKVYVRLRYTNSIALAFAGLNDIVFSGNNLESPDLQAATEQPRGFREWMSVYDKFKVHKSSIVIDVLNLDNSLAFDSVVVPHIIASPTITDTEDAREQPYAKSKRIAPRGSGSYKTIRNNMKTKVIYGHKFIDDDYAGNVSTPPLNQWFWTFYYQNLVNDVGATNCDVSFAVTYYCEFFAREFIPRSVEPS